jgi:hypothetical protein
MAHVAMDLFFDDKEFSFGPISLIWLVFSTCEYIIAVH